MTLKCAACGRAPRDGEKLAKSPLTACEFCPQCCPFDHDHKADTSHLPDEHRDRMLDVYGGNWREET